MDRHADRQPVRRHVAYTDGERMIHIRPVTVPRSRISLFDWRADS
ncbi:hypothetical protein ACIBBD_17990 [Streptomyces sp. NPDC051315]